MENKNYTFEYTENVWRVYVLPLVIFFISLLILPFSTRTGVFLTLLITPGIPLLLAYLLARNVKNVVASVTVINVVAVFVLVKHK